VALRNLKDEARATKFCKSQNTAIVLPVALVSLLVLQKIFKSSY